MYKNQADKLKDLFGVKGAAKEFYALKNLSFEVEAGDVVGLVGMNGSGKSTLANILAGISLPTEGNVTIAGRPAIIAISVGLNLSLTGMENIELKGLMIGLSLKQIAKIKESIIDFADIGDFIDQPVKTYSSGMKSRLGFAISVNIDPDILVVDEALSVGDSTFTKKCLDKMNEFREAGKTIFFISHSIGQVYEFCTKAMWLEYGMMKAYADTQTVLPMYERFINAYNAMDPQEKTDYKTSILESQQQLLAGSAGRV